MGQRVLGGRAESLWLLLTAIDVLEFGDVLDVEGEGERGIKVNVLGF